MSGFDFGDIFTILPKLAPLWPRIKAAVEKVEQIANDPKAIAAVTEAQKIMSDPGVKDAIATFHEVAAALQAVQSEQEVLSNQ